MNEWQSMDFLSGRRVKIKNGKASYSGKADGIDPSGGLLIKLRNGRHKIAHAGEVSLIP